MYRYWWYGFRTGPRYRAMALGTFLVGLMVILVGIWLARGIEVWILFGFGMSLVVAGGIWDRGIRRALGLDDTSYG